MGTRRWFTAVVGASLALAACSGGGTSQHKTTQSQAAPSGGNPCPPASCAANVNGPSTTTSPNTSRAGSSNALQAWTAQHLASLETLNSQASHLLGGAGDVEQVKLACSQVGSSAEAALAAPPPPDAAIAARLQSALTQLAQLARDCRTAFTGGDPAAASRLVYEANQGTAAIAAVIHSLNTAGHSSS